MSYRSALLVIGPLLLACGCTSAPSGTDADAQAIVEAIARRHPECIRLTVHSASGGDSRVIASTRAEKLGQRSDPEDLEAMASGTMVVLDEPGAIDVTVPILHDAGKWTGACGVTMTAPDGADRAKLVAAAAGIAKEVEAQLRRKRR